MRRWLEPGHLWQFVKYGLAGGAATLVHIAVFHLAAWKLFPALQERDFLVVLLGLSVQEVDVASRSLNSMLANGVAFLFGNLTAYLLNIRFVFEAGRHRRSVEIGFFYLVSGVSIAAGTALMGFLIRHFGLATTVAFGANLVTALMINFLMRKYYIFKG